MTTIQSDLTPPVLVDAINRNLHEALEAMGKTSISEHSRTDILARWWTPVPHPWFNGVLALANAPANADALIAETLGYFNDRHVTTVTCWLSPNVERTGWESALAARGFTVIGGPPGMALELSQFNTSWLPDSLEIKRVSDARSLDDWGKTFITGYGLNPAWENDYRQLMAELDKFLPTRNYVGYVDGEPVSVSSLILSAGVAGIYNVATPEAHRGNGYGAALTAMALKDAKELGYKVSILQASELGFPIYLKLGFKEYCNAGYFQWQA